MNTASSPGCLRRTISASRCSISAAISFFFFLGGIFATVIRLELLTPPGDLVSAQTYNKLFTLHGVIMVFLFMIPSIPATLGNFLCPLMIGAKDLAFPKLNLLSWYILMAGGGLVHVRHAGWAASTPAGLSILPFSTSYANTYVILTAVGIFIAGFSSILTGLNFIVTIHRMRAPGLTWFRLPLFIWSIYATSIIQVLGTPVIAVTLLLVAVERGFHHRHFRSRAGRRPGAVPAFVLVLFAPGGLYHGAAGNGHHQ